MPTKVQKVITLDRDEILAFCGDGDRKLKSIQSKLKAKVIPIKNVLFASEMVGAVRGIDPETGHNFDDTKRYIDDAPISAQEKEQIFSGNVQKVFSRLKI